MSGVLPPGTVSAGHAGRRRAAPLRALLGAAGVLLATAAVALPGCGDRLEPGGDCPPMQNPLAYTTDVAPFLASKCVACHNSAKHGDARFGAPAGINYDGYDNARSNWQAGSLDVLNGRMPPGGTIEDASACVLDAWAGNNFAR